MLKRWRFAWAWFVGATLITLAGCNGFPPGPQPTPSPTATPTPWECPLEMPGCHETEPPQQCSSEASPCWHNPTGQPEHCEEAPKCDEPELPQPQCPTFTDRAGIVRTLDDPCDCYFGQAWNPCPEPQVCDFPQGIEDRITPAAHNPGTMGSVVNRAMADITGCPVGQNPCPISFQVDVWFNLVCERIREMGFCCGRHDNEPPGATDQISVKATDFCDGGQHENYRVINPAENGVRWFPSAKLDAWNVDCGDVGPTPPPTPSPPPGSDCPDPHPETCEEWGFGLKKHGPDWDSTFQCRKSCAYCEAIGMGEHGGVIRCGCPVRPECGHDAEPDAICHDRPACEADMIGEQQWWCDGQKIESNENSAQARCHGHVKTCTEDGRTCGEADW